MKSINCTRIYRKWYLSLEKNTKMDLKESSDAKYNSMRYLISVLNLYKEKIVFEIIYSL